MKTTKTPPDAFGVIDEPFEFAPEGEGDAELAEIIKQGIREMGEVLNEEAPAKIVAGLDVSAVRAQTGLSQPAFAALIGARVATLRAWEQGRRTPTGPTKKLLRLLEQDPVLVMRMLSGGEAETSTAQR